MLIQSAREGQATHRQHIGGLSATHSQCAWVCLGAMSGKSVMTGGAWFTDEPVHHGAQQSTSASTDMRVPNGVLANQTARTQD